MYQLPLFVGLGVLYSCLFYCFLEWSQANHALLQGLQACSLLHTRPRGDGERCVTPARAAAKETTRPVEVWKETSKGPGETRFSSDLIG